MSRCILQKISRIKKNLDTKSFKTLIHALVMSKLDCNNGLLQGLPKKSLAPMQREQNSAARFITGTKRSEHITPVLKDLHWLPVNRRIDLKIICLTHKALNTGAPEYLASLLKPHSGIRVTRRSTRNMLLVPRPKTGFGTRSFQAAAARLWNTLPDTLKDNKDTLSFRKGLKTWLFTIKSA
ncbi:uncharacterized protein LOC135482892 [Lineus longissimus]|uniref:uncharacterized protein LOC135482892 n=1 Tax=Lineus longissimus TaxID=88925 RepID=UPI00315D766E